MKLKEILNLNNIKSFIVGNSLYYYDMMIGLPEYYKEQVIYRMDKCKDDCLPNGECIKCGCPTIKKMMNPESCNGGERFPDIMNKEDWEEFKKENNIED